jgi:hypothetical protein
MVTVGRIILADPMGMVLGDPLAAARQDLVAPAAPDPEGKAALAILVAAAVLIAVVADGNPPAASDPDQRLTTFIPPSA